MRQNTFAAGAPVGGAYSAPHTPTWIWGGEGREQKGDEGKGKGGRERGG